MNLDQGVDLCKDDMPFYDAERSTSLKLADMDLIRKRTNTSFTFTMWTCILTYRLHKQYAQLLYTQPETGLSGKSVRFNPKSEPYRY